MFWTRYRITSIMCMTCTNKTDNYKKDYQAISNSDRILVKLI